MAEGYTLSQLAQEFGLSVSGFRKYYQKHNLPPDLPENRFSKKLAKKIRKLREASTRIKKADIAQIPTPDATPVDELTQAVTGAQEPLQASFEPVDNETPEEPVDDASTALVDPTAPLVEPTPAAPKDSENFSATDLSEKFPVPKSGDSAATPKQQGEDAPTYVPEQAETAAIIPAERNNSTDELSIAPVDAQEPLRAPLEPVDDTTPVHVEAPSENPVEGEKKSPDTDEKDSKEPMNEFNVDFTTRDSFTQRLENLPAEILALPRFFPVKEDKHPCIGAWQNPENQRAHQDVQGLKGFDISGHGQGDDYLLIDFDHVLNDAGEFVNETAEDWYNSIQLTFKGYCERSISGHGLHILAKPTPEKFVAISGKAGVLHLDPNNHEIKIELFFKTTRYCLLTGDLYDCEPNAPIAEGETVDEVLQDLLNEIQKQLDAQPTPPTKSKHMKDTSPNRQDEPEYDIFRATKMLEVLSTVDHKDMTYNQWLAINTACKNIGVPYSVVDAFNQCDPTNYNAEQNRRRWEGLNDPKYDIETLHGIAKQFGYDEKAVWHEWHDGRKENTPQQHQAHLSEQTPLESSNEEIIASIREACEWRRNKDADGNFKRTSIKPTYANIKLIFENDPNLRGLVGYDQFQGADVFLKRAPWHDIDHTGEQWNDDAQLRMYLRANYAELKEKQLIEDAVIEFSRRNSFNAVQQFLEALPQWDGIPRAETLFIKFLHAEDSDFTRKVTMNWLLGAIARVYHPGCDFQICLVLQGAQRIGKSKLVKMLGGKEGVNPKGQNWHVALKDSVDDAHAVDALQKGWIIEIEEFSAARRAEINALKSYISADDDTRRFAYDRRATTRKRNVVFVVTCNDEQFLRDPTGNARFIIIKCSQKKFDRVAGMTPEYIRQVWAEVLWKYKETFKHGFDETKLQLPLEHQIQAEKIAEAFMADDGLTNEIQGYLNRKITAQIVWQLLTKEERRKFIADGNLRLFHAYEELTSRRKARGKKDIEADLDKIHSICTSNVGIRKDNDATYFYGTEYRNHICAAEIHNECFGNDPRKRMNRINEILSTLEGWTLGERLRKADPEYPDQKKPYYRDEGKLPPDEEDTEGDSNTQPNDFIGETLSLEDPPF